MNIDAMIRRIERMEQALQDQDRHVTIRTCWGDETLEHVPGAILIKTDWNTIGIVEDEQVKS